MVSEHENNAFGPVPGDIQEKYAPYISSFEIALKREIKEELSIDISSNCIAPLTFSVDYHNTHQKILLLHICRISQIQIGWNYWNIQTRIFSFLQFQLCLHRILLHRKQSSNGVVNLKNRRHFSTH